MNKTDTKNQLRQYFKNFAVDINLKNFEDAILLNKTKNYLRQNPPKIIGLYTPFAFEPNVTPLHDFCHSNSMQTAYPAIQNEQMIYRLANNLSSLQKGKLGFLEPPATNIMVEPDLLVVPGIAFSLKGERLGRGQGHFDKYIAKHHPKTLSLVFSWMILEKIPLEPHDKLINLVLSIRE